MVLAPVFVQIALTFLLLLWMGSLRLVALRAGAVRVRDVALGQPAWPDRPTQVGRAFHNQFELPVLFYVLVVLALITRKADAVFVVLEWLFVLSRLVHAAVHTGSNSMLPRFVVFAFGAIVLIAAWIIVALSILAATP
jgi:hypothetical protein